VLLDQCAGILTAKIFGLKGVSKTTSEFLGKKYGTLCNHLIYIFIKAAEGAHSRLTISQTPNACVSAKLFLTARMTNLSMNHDYQVIASPVWRQRLSVALRVLGAVFAGYAFSAALVALLALMLPLVGMPKSEAVVLASMLGFPIYLAVLIWAFSERRPWRIWLCLGAGTAIALLLAWLLKP
jgi:hypothetical protein